MSWLARVRHDLLKHALWSARDLAAAVEKRAPRPADVALLRRSLLELRDGEGRSVALGGLWRGLREEYDGAAPGAAAALAAFTVAVIAAEEAVAELTDAARLPAALAAVLALEAAFEALARELK